MRDRIKKIVDELNITQKVLSEAIGIKPSTLSDFLNGRFKTLSSDTIRNLLLKYNINPIWLLTGEGDMFLNLTSRPPLPRGKGEQPVQEVQESTPNYIAGKNGFTAIEGGAPPVTLENLNRDNIHQSEWFRSLPKKKQLAIILLLEINDERFFDDAVGYLSYKVEQEKKTKEEEKEYLDKKGEAG